MRILVADPGPDADGLADALERNGHEAWVARNGTAALEGTAWAQVVLTELDLPDRDGVTLCRDIRAVGDLPLIVLSGRATEVERVLVLRAGADDVLLKPYGLLELLARIDAVVRRWARPADESTVIAHSTLRIDRASHQVCVGDRRVETTRKEFALLALLASEPREVITRERIMAEVWQDNCTPSNSRTIDTHVNTLRRKLGSREWISTVRGVGFRIGSGVRGLRAA